MTHIIWWFIWFLGGAVLVYGGNWLLRWWASHRSEGWPMTVATVEQRYVEEGRRSHAATIAYSYSVNGEYYAGLATWHFPLEAMAYKFIERYPTDAKMMVRYKPEKPEVSVLREQDQMVNAASG
jgi:hypothetical protein